MIRPQLTTIGKEVFERRYRWNNESVTGMFQRVAKHIASAEEEKERDKWEEKFYELMASLKFLPNSPTLFSAGTGKGLLSACFLFVIEDSLESIMECQRLSGLVQKYGGGVGYALSRVRKRDAPVNSVQGYACGPVSLLDYYDSVARLITQGGRRAGAQMGILSVEHPDIKDFIVAKNENPQALSTFNISVGLTDDFMNKVKEGDKESVLLFREIAEAAWKTGDPGCYFIDRAEAENPTPWLGKLEGTNPCFTGDTLIAVADGRVAVPIKQLAEEGKDIPVYCCDENGVVKIRMGRNPRLTREKAEVWKVVLDDNSNIRATPDHTFLLKNGERVKLRDLQIGDSLIPFNKYEYKNRNKMYYRTHLNNEKFDYIKEEQMIWEFENASLLSGEIIHHIDGNGLNNAIENLYLTTLLSHNEIHGFTDVAGEKNGMYGRRHSADTISKISQIQRQRMENNEIRQSISISLKQYYKENGTEQLKGQRVFHKTEIRNCENCDVGFETRKDSVRRFCSKYCSNIWVNQNTTRKGMFSVGALLKIGASAKAYGATLEGKEAKRRAAEASHVACRKNKELVNHKIVSVEFFGYEDVYNLTVDEFHTIAVITDMNARTLKGKNKRITGLITSQCGEVPLLHAEACNLGSMNLSKYVDVKAKDFYWDELAADVMLAVRFLDNVVTVNEFPDPVITEAVRKTRKIGLGVMGWADALADFEIDYDSKEAVDLGRKTISFIRKVADQKSLELADEKGVAPAFLGDDHNVFPQPRNATRLSIAPTGSISILAGCSSGIEPHYELEYTRRMYDHGKEVELHVKEPILEVLEAKGTLFRPKTALRIASEWHIKQQAAFQDSVDLAVSKTINLPESATVDDIEKAYIMMWELGCKGGTVYRDKCRDNQVLGEQRGAAVIGRKKLPAERAAITRRFTVGGTKGYLTIGHYDDGKPGEIFVNISKEGSTLGGLMDTVALLTSLALQYNIPLDSIANKLAGTSFEPMGFTDDPKIPNATSLVDYIFRLLKSKYGEEADIEQKSGNLCPDCGKPLLYQNGCISCNLCGFSRC